MEKISFTHKETGETVDFYVLEETRLNGVDYILVTDSQGGRRRGADFKGFNPLTEIVRLFMKS